MITSFIIIFIIHSLDHLLVSHHLILIYIYLKLSSFAPICSLKLYFTPTKLYSQIKPDHIKNVIANQAVCI